MHSQAEFSFEERYGLNKKRASWKIPAALIAILGIAWTLWAGLHHASPEIRSTLISFNVTGENEITLRYQLELRNPTGEIICTLAARDIDKTIIGQLDDRFPAQVGRFTRETAIHTRTSPVSAGITRCRAAE